MTMQRWSALAGLLCMLGISAPACAAPDTAQQKTAVAYFAGGCFWCMESDFEQLKGVGDVISGYMGGHTPNPSYESVSAGGTGYAESVKVPYDPSQISYPQLLSFFWHHIDPLTANAQFCDHGNQYRSEIFVQNAQQLQLAKASKQKVTKQLGQKVYTQIANAQTFYPAEKYHQNYYKKNSIRYHFYRYNCGRDERVQAVWGDILNKP